MTVNPSRKLSVGRKFKKLNMAGFDKTKCYESEANKNEDIPMKIFEKLVSKWRDLIGREIHVTTVQPPLASI